MGKFKLPSLLSLQQSTCSVDKAGLKKTNRRSWMPSNGGSDETKKSIKRSFSAALSTMIFTKSGSQTATQGTRSSRLSTPREDVSGASDAKSLTRMSELSRKIADSTAKLEAYMQANGLLAPSLDAMSAKGFPKLPEEINECRKDIILATKELAILAHGPSEALRWGIWDFLDVLALSAVNHYGIAKLWPAGETTTLAELQAKAAPLDAINVTRFVRGAMTNHIFSEPSPGVIAHTSLSRALAEDENLQAWIGFNGEDILPAAGKVLQALKIHPEAVDLKRTGFNFAFDTVDKEPMFATFGREQFRAKRMGRAMASLTQGQGYEVHYLVDSYDLDDVDARAGTFVDVGGSHGFVCVDLARKYRNMKFVVQDTPKTVETAPKPIDEDEQIVSRITFQGHDFFTEQPVKGADVYFFRWIMHNLSTPYAVKVIKNLVPSLRPGARVVINDHCLGVSGRENPWDESIIRKMDLVMLALLNAQERTEEEFRTLFREADQGFVFRGVTRPKGCRMSIVEAVWQPRDNKDGKKKIN